MRAEAAAKTTTAEAALREESCDANIISGGLLAAKALKA